MAMDKVESIGSIEPSGEITIHQTVDRWGTEYQSKLTLPYDQWLWILQSFVKDWQKYMDEIGIQPLMGAICRDTVTTAEGL
jgi:hypothetical protein